jgi:hypothetical protein
VRLVRPTVIPATPPGPPRPYAEFSLRFVLDRCTPVSPTAGARLDAMEGVLASLVRRWHAGAPLSPARDVRLAPSTLEAMMRWVEAAAPDPAALERLGVYHSGAVADASVPRGWVRVYLGSERSGPGELRAQGH